jgi:hypothetical protein
MPVLAAEHASGGLNVSAAPHRGSAAVGDFATGDGRKISRGEILCGPSSKCQRTSAPAIVAGTERMILISRAFSGAVPS